jgi:carbon-monoxide dehydrogenase medium subunit
MITTFKYRAPVTRAELHGLLADHGGDARLLAGGTDLLGDIRMGLRRPEVVVDLKKVGDFPGIEWSEADGLMIGPAVTISDVLASDVIRERFPLLIACARDLASHQIRNRATVVGNIVNASPCADMAPGLLCLGARAVISSARGPREVALGDFFAGVKETVLRPDEVLEGIVVPPEASGARGNYRKLKRINGHDLGIVGVALCKLGGLIRLGISSCAPTPLSVNGLAETASADEVVAAARSAITPISDVRASKEYREFMVEVFVRRLHQEVA